MKIPHTKIGPRNGPPVLLLHGIPGSSATWTDVESLIAGRVQTIVPDLLGFGDSPAFEGDGHAAEQSEALLRMLDTERIETVHVVGFDFGGPTAVLLYRRAANRVRSLTLAATNVWTDTRIPGPLRIAQVPVIGEWMFQAMFTDVGLSGLWFGATRDRESFPRRRFLAEAGGEKGRSTARQIFLHSLRDLRSLYREVEETLPHIAVPSCVVWGDHDPFFPLAVGRRTHAAIPAAALKVLEGCGHFIPAERPSAFASIIEETVARGERAIRARRIS